MTLTEINKQIAIIEGHRVAGINEAGQVFIATKGKQDRLYNPAENWGEGGKLIEKYRVTVIPNYMTGPFIATVENDMNNLVSGDTYLKAGMTAIIETMKQYDKSEQ